MVDKRGMFLVGTIFYAIAAFQLIFFALSWLHLLTGKQIMIGLAIGVPVGVFKYFMVFHKNNKANKVRLLGQAGKQKFYTVFKAKTYFIILGMIALGLSLRLIFDVNRKFLMPLYLAIGIALFMSFVFYLVNYLTFRGLDK